MMKVENSELKKYLDKLGKEKNALEVILGDQEEEAKAEVVELQHKLEDVKSGPFGDACIAMLEADNMKL